MSNFPLPDHHAVSNSSSQEDLQMTSEQISAFATSKSLGNTCHQRSLALKSNKKSLAQSALSLQHDQVTSIFSKNSFNVNAFREKSRIELQKFRLSIRKLTLLCPFFQITCHYPHLPSAHDTLSRRGALIFCLRDSRVDHKLSSC